MAIPTAACLAHANAVISTFSVTFAKRLDLCQTPPTAAWDKVLVYAYSANLRCKMKPPPLSFAITVPIIIILMWSSAAGAQERRPCLYRNVPAGCVPAMGLPKPTLGVAIDPDLPGLVPVSELPLVKARTTPDESQPPPDSRSGTVTVEPVTPDEQSRPPAPPQL